MSQSTDLEGLVKEGLCYLLLRPMLSGSYNVYEVPIASGHHQIQLTPMQPPKPSGETSNFGDSSGPLFSIYSRAAEDEDNKMLERWQKDADGILIFVSPRPRIDAHIYNLDYDRPVCSPPHSLRSLA